MTFRNAQLEHCLLIKVILHGYGKDYSVFILRLDSNIESKSSNNTYLNIIEIVLSWLNVCESRYRIEPLPHSRGGTPGARNLRDPGSLRRAPGQKGPTRRVPECIESIHTHTFALII